MAGKTPEPREILPIRILVVDDEPLIRWALCTALAAAGFDAVAASSAEDARRIALQWPPPRVALLDVTPEGQGLELIADIGRVYPTCRFVVMSTARHAPEAAGWLPVVRMIEKPFDLATVVRLVTEIAAEAEEGA